MEEGVGRLMMKQKKYVWESTEKKIERLKGVYIKSKTKVNEAWKDE